MDHREITAEEKALTTEMAALAKQQSDALQKAAYFLMGKDELINYDRRAERIGEICRLLKAIRN